MRLKDLDGVIRTCVRLYDSEFRKLGDYWDSTKELNEMFSKYGQSKVLSIDPFSEEEYGDIFYWLEIRIDTVNY
jgi:hypothetical protein